SLTLYAKWDPSSATSPTTYTLSFNSNGGTSVSSITEESGTAISAPQSPSKNGYSFVGWYEDSALTTPFTFDTMPSTSKTLYAKWEATQTNPTLYTLSFNSNGGSIHSPLSLEGGANIPDLPTPSKTNFTFEGWFMDVQLTTPFTSSTMPSSNVTLYAKWESEPTIDDLLVGSLESDDYGFECISGICTLNLASNVYYEYSVASKTFSFTSLADTVENGYYRVKNETLSIDSSWDVDYSYELEENYGIFYNVDFEYSGNAQTTSYSVAKYDSNYTSEATLISNAENRITQLKGLIDAIFDTIEDTEFEDLN
ncbi:MAG: InlB B-repeat-containing protein, partial [Bacillota bacterium]